MWEVPMGSEHGSIRCIKTMLGHETAVRILILNSKEELISGSSDRWCIFYLNFFCLYFKSLYSFLKNF